MIDVQDNVIRLTRGDTGTFKLNVKDLNEANYNFASDEVLFTVKRNTITKDIVIAKAVSSDGIIKVLPSDTNNLTYGKYWYDVQITKPNGDVYTVIPPTEFNIMQEVTF